MHVLNASERNQSNRKEEYNARLRTEVADGAVHGVAAGEQELHEPRGDEPAGAGHAHRCTSGHGLAPPPPSHRLTAAAKQPVDS